MPGTVPKPFVFVLMPFASEFDDVYRLGIQKGCKEAGAYCERVDEQIFQESMLDRIYNQIAKADIVVADMSGKNPNVFYETGYAHALGKRTILLTHDADDIPFDLKHYPHIVYGGKIVQLKSEIKKRVGYLLKHPEEKKPDDYKCLEVVVEGVRIERNMLLELTAIKSPRPLDNENLYTKQWPLSFDLHNPTDRTVSLARVQYGLVFPEELGKPEGAFANISKVNRDSFMYMHKGNSYGSILPGCYEHDCACIVKQRTAIPFDKLMPCSVRVFSELSPEEIGFHVVVREMPATIR